MTQTAAPPTLEGLFRRLLARRPEAPALADPPDKLRVTGQQPRRLTFAQADQAISALAAHFVEAGLPANSVIAVASNPLSSTAITETMIMSGTS